MFDIKNAKAFLATDKLEIIIMERFLTNTIPKSKKFCLKQVYDYFFDNNGILKCDLDTNINMLIKNFLNTIIYELIDNKAKTMLLLKLNSKYPFLISEKIFYEFDW